jgi:hypothetical protein
MARDGYAVFPYDQRVADWAAAAHDLGLAVLAGDGERRHGGTWFVGVDALPNATDGSVGGVPLEGVWLDQVTPPAQWHAAQLSVVFPGYPRQDPDESDAAHRFRRKRDAAHVDGLLPEGPNKRRHLREPHGFIVGFPLNKVEASPLVVWQASHAIMGSAFTEVFAGLRPSDWPEVDVTEAYQIARRAVFNTCTRVEVRCGPGQAVLLHRHLLHGVAPWSGRDDATKRMMAYFRPIAPLNAWLE